MKKLLIGSLVGGIIIFLCQFLSWGLLNLHGSMTTYTPKEDSVLNFLNSQFSDDGFYMVPGYKPGLSHDEMEKQMKERVGKPWAQVYYHKAMNENMAGNMVRGLIVDIVMVWLLCWILRRMTAQGFGAILLTSLFTGMIGFLFFAYIYHIWFQTTDVMAHLADTVVSWGLCGMWLGWWLPGK